MWSLFEIFIILLLLNVIFWLSILILKLLMPLIFFRFFFFLHRRHLLKIWCYTRVRMVTVRLIFFRLWTSISDLCICKVFHCFTWLTLSWTIRGRLISGVFFAVYFVIMSYMFVIYYVVNLQFWSMNQKILSSRRFFSTSWRKGGLYVWELELQYCMDSLAFHIENYCMNRNLT